MTRTVLQALTSDRPLGSTRHGTRGAGFLVLLVAVLVAASWIFFKAFIVASAIAGLGAALLIRRWHTGHPSRLPYAARTRDPEINLSRIPVGGDVAGLMFAAGSVAIVIVGVPDMAWYFVSALVCAALFAWATFAAHAARACRRRDGRPLGLMS
jgi:hypothetical protein